MRSLPDSAAGGVPFLAEVSRNNVRIVVENIVDRLGECRFIPLELQAVLNELPEEYRTPLILFYFQEFSYKEIAAQLDAARPGFDDDQSSDLRSASAHIDDCSDCRREFQARQTLDLRISDAMRDVAIPDGLKERLFESLNLGGAAFSSSDSKHHEAIPVEPVARVNSKTGFNDVRVRIAAAVSVSAVLVAALCFLFPPRTPHARFTLSDVRHSADLRLDTLPAFDGNFEPELPKGPWLRSPQITVVTPPKGDLKNKAGLHRSASYAFRVRDQHGRVYHGVLLAIPRSMLDDEPDRDAFDSADDEQGKYLSKAGGKFHSVAWKEGKFVYVCFISVEGEGLKTLENALYPPLA
eukprot:g8374.t1